MYYSINCSARDIESFTYIVTRDSARIFRIEVELAYLRVETIQFRVIEFYLDARNALRRAEEQKTLSVLYYYLRRRSGPLVSLTISFLLICEV